MDVTAIIVNYNTAHLLEKAIGLLRQSAGPLRLQIAIVDNASRDGSMALIGEKFADCDVIANEHNVGFGRANNQVLPLVRGRHVLLLNTDAFVSPQTLQETVAFMDEHPECGLLGVRLSGRDGELQPSCRYFPTPLNIFWARTGLSRLIGGVRLMDDMRWPHDAVRECDWVPGCYYLVRRAVIDQVGLFDPRFFLYYEEVDHCRAVKAAGWRVMFYPHTTVIHLGGESAKSEGEVTAGAQQIGALQVESELLYMRKHHGLAGALAHLGLIALADVVLALKHVVRLRPLDGLAGFWREFATYCSLWRRTAWGTRPTR